MLKQIIRKEMLENLMSLRFAINAVLCLVVALTSLYVRGTEFGQVRDDFFQEKAITQQEMKTVRHPWNFWDVARVHKEINPLKIFVKGTQQRNGGTYGIDAYWDPMPITDQVLNTSVPLFPSLDLIFFVGVILSLMAIVFGYDSICGEKEKGTLRLMLSNSVPRDQVLIGKWIGGYIPLVLPFIICSLGMMAIVTLQTGFALTAGQWGRIGMILLLSLIYLAAIFTISVWISTITHRSSTSMIVLATLWVFIVVVVPNSIPFVAKTIRPDSKHLLEEEDKGLQALIQDVFRSGCHKELQTRAEQEFGNGQNLNWNDPQVRIRVAEFNRDYNVCGKETYKIALTRLAQIKEKGKNERKAQLDLGHKMARLSPFCCFALSTAEMAGEGPRANEGFLRELTLYREKLGYHIQDEGIATANATIKNNGNDVAWDPTANPAPSFYYHELGALKSISTIAWDFAILVLVTIVFFMLAMIGFLRYDVR